MDPTPLVALLADRFVVALATQDSAGGPYATPLFYALVDREPPRLAFASSARSAHAEHLGDGPTPAAGAVWDETEDVAAIRGAQLRGTVLPVDRLPPGGAERVRTAYLARHPVARPVLAAGAHRLYVFAITWAKLTDNARLGLGCHATFEFPVRRSE